MEDEVIHLTRRQLREERELQQRREQPTRRDLAAARRRPRRSVSRTALRGPLGLALLWLAGHLAAAAAFLTRFGTNPDRWNTLVVGETVAQFTALTQLARLPFERVMTDVPAPAARLLQALYAVTAGDRGWFLLAVLGLALLADLAVLVLLWRSRSAGQVAAAYWAIGVALLGPVAYARLDLLVVACVVLAWILAPRRPLWAAVPLALGTALAWWPALVLLPLVSLAPAGRRLRAFIGYAVLLLAVVAVCSWGGGWGRAVSSLTRLWARGLHIESLPAAPTLVDLATSPGRHAASVIAGELEVRGAWVAASLTTSTVLVVIAGAIAVALGALLIRRLGAPDLLPGRSAAMTLTIAAGTVSVTAPNAPDGGRAAYRAMRRRTVKPTDGGLVAALVATAGLLGVLATGHLLKPEFLLWPLPFLAVVAARRPGRAVWAALGVELLTQVDYPYLFGFLSFPSAGTFDQAAAVIVARNLGLLSVLSWCWSAVWREMRQLGRVGRVAVRRTDPAAPVTDPAVTRAK